MENNKETNLGRLDIKVESVRSKGHRGRQLCTMNGLWDKNTEKKRTENNGKKEVSKQREKNILEAEGGGKF